jgi:hypothetical protein
MTIDDDRRKLQLRIISFLIFLAILPQLTNSQELYLVNLRADLYDTEELCVLEQTAIARVPADLLNDSSRVLLQESWTHLQASNTEELSQNIKGKRIAICIHGMAKSYGAASKDLLNNYWNLRKASPGYYDIIIGVTWPGGSHLGGGPFFRANRTSKRAGALFAPLLAQLENNAQNVDVITHSMGSKILMQALKKSSVQIDHAFLLAPSIFRNSLQPWRKWGTEGRQIEQIVAFHSEHDYAFSWTSIQHLGLGYRGTRRPETRAFTNYFQVNCSSVINQSEYARLEKGPFKSRSNHSMYNQSVPVFRMINSVLQGNELCASRSCELYVSNSQKH